jgi:very-short-patch-repair endonuclease
VSIETSRTRPHRRIERLLDAEGIAYITECEDFPPYCLDLYLGEWHLCVEVDGPTHAKYSLKDRARDALLIERYSIPTLRLSTELSAPDSRARLIEFIEQWAESSDERKRQQHG